MMNVVVSISLLMIFAFGTDGLRRQEQPVVSQNKFFCNVKALTPTERADHKELTAKLLAERKESVETPTGYEFQFNPKSVSLAELADWVTAESKCCSFLDFHIDVEAEGNLLCLRLTGAQGVKDFIRSEFAVKNGR
ncbi:MAG TPA: hypothetical protein VGJ06_16905 [Candidatus Acidoferrum sp.]|jgi:hypothetical protein